MFCVETTFGHRETYVSGAVSVEVSLEKSLTGILGNKLGGIFGRGFSSKVAYGNPEHQTCQNGPLESDVSFGFYEFIVKRCA